VAFGFPGATLVVALSFITSVGIGFAILANAPLLRLIGLALFTAGLVALVITHSLRFLVVRFSRGRRNPPDMLSSDLES
jgi:ABC-type nitrate/sulfonate/bicarbonate transport system permease component